ncbi:hypothetical protein F5Y18DRAFT_331666 [Xylariaceae sp. FL1019]|nr:hypothetical protein F5Y18DRAFT_331666 [Xylariaceae sp. FL1019]
MNTSVHVQLPQNLNDVRIASLPSAAFYIPDFITKDEEEHILNKIASAPKPRWKQLTRRRLQTWPSDLVNNKLVEAPLPPWLDDPIISRLLSLHVDSDTGSAATIFANSPHQRPNHVLINEYPPGIGIMPHKDGSAYHPIVCTVSLGASICLNIHETKKDGALESVPSWRILQEPRSLLITTADLYTDYLHGISDMEEDIELSDTTIVNWSLLGSPESFQSGRNPRQLRTSLTYRDVISVSKLGTKFGLFNHKKP